jgi:excisionase family DNA binding protein
MANGYANAVSGSCLSRLPMELMSTSELAALLRCRPRTPRKLHRRGVLRSIRIGRCFRFDYRESVEALSSPPR